MMFNLYSHNDNPYEMAGYDVKGAYTTPSALSGIEEAPLIHAENPMDQAMAELRAKYVSQGVR